MAKTVEKNMRPMANIGARFMRIMKIEEKVIISGTMLKIN